MSHFSNYDNMLILNMESQSKFRPDPKLKLMDQLREGLRYHHYAYRTEQTYCQWYQSPGLWPTQTNHGKKFRAQPPGQRCGRSVDRHLFHGRAGGNFHGHFQSAGLRHPLLLRQVNQIIRGQINSLSGKILNSVKVCRTS